MWGERKRVWVCASRGAGGAEVPDTTDTRLCPFGAHSTADAGEKAETDGITLCQGRVEQKEGEVAMEPTRRMSTLLLSARAAAALVALAVLGAGCKATRGAACARNEDCRSGLLCVDIEGGRKTCAESAPKPVTAKREAVEAVSRALSLPNDVRDRMRVSAIGVWAIVDDPKGLCFLLKRGAVGGFVLMGQFPRGKLVLPPIQGGEPWGFRAEVPGCFPAPRP